MRICFPLLSKEKVHEKANIWQKIKKNYLRGKCALNMSQDEEHVMFFLMMMMMMMMMMTTKRRKDKPIYRSYDKTLKQTLIICVMRKLENTPSIGLGLHEGVPF